MKYFKQAMLGLSFFASSFNSTPVFAQVRNTGEAYPSTDMRINDNGAVIGGTVGGQYFIFEKNTHRAIPAPYEPNDINNSNELTATLWYSNGVQFRPSRQLVRIDSASGVHLLNSNVGGRGRINEGGEVASAPIVMIDPNDLYCIRGGDLSYFCPTNSVPALFSSAGIMTLLRESLPDDLFGNVYGLNGSSDIAGSRFAGTRLAFRKLHNGTVEIIPSIGGWISDAFGINDNGVVVGQAETIGREFRAFRYDGTISTLGTLGGDYSAARAINNRGDIVGSSKNAAGEERAFIFQNGVMRDLNEFVPPSRNLRLVTATDINEFQEVTGVAMQGGRHVGYRFSFVETGFSPSRSCRRSSRDSRVIRISQQCRVYGTLRDYAGNRLANRLLILQYSATRSGPFKGISLVRTNSRGDYTKTLRVRNAGFYRAIGPIYDARLPFVPSGQIEAR